MDLLQQLQKMLALTELEVSDFQQNQLVQLVELLNKHRSTTGNFDCIVPVSGGKDGSYVAHMLKEKYNCFYYPSKQSRCILYQQTCMLLVPHIWTLYKQPTIYIFPMIGD
jgi:hypothetical protein